MRPSDKDASEYFTEQAFIDILQFPGEKSFINNKV